MMRLAFLPFFTLVLGACQTTDSQQDYTVVSRPISSETVSNTPTPPANSKRFANTYYTTAVKRALTMLARIHYTSPTSIADYEQRVIRSLISKLDPSGILLSEADLAQLSEPRFNFQATQKSGDIGALDDAIDNIVEALQKNLALLVEPANTPPALRQQFQNQIKPYMTALAEAGYSQTDINTAIVEHVQYLDNRLTSLSVQQRYHIILNAFAQAIDSHSRYIPPESATHFQAIAPVSNQPEHQLGIGLNLINNNTHVFVEQVTRNTYSTRPVVPGTEILAIMDNTRPQLLWGLDLDAIDAMLTGTVDSAVPLLVKQNNTVEEITFYRVSPPTAKNTPQVDIIKANDAHTVDVAVLTIPSFYAGMSEYVESELHKLQQAGISRLVIDLRNNGGGSLNEATSLTGLFTGGGPVFQMKDPSGKVFVRNSTNTEMAFTGDLLVLVNAATAGGSEIFAAAIQDYQRGVVLGTSTFGYGTIQQHRALDRIYDVSDVSMGSMQFTIATFYRVTGASTQLKGVTPDIPLTTAEPWLQRESDSLYALEWEQIKSATYEKHKATAERVNTIQRFASKTTSLSDDAMAAAIAIAKAY